MKKNIFLLAIILVLIAACNNDEAEINIGQEENPVTFTTRADATDDVSVLIFGKEQVADKYKEPFTPKWVNGKAQKALHIGTTYNFLFYKLKKGQQQVTTTPLEGGYNKKAEEIKFNAKPVTGKAGYYQPVEFIWLPKDKASPRKDYKFTGIGTNEVKETLQNVTSKVDVILKRGKKNAGGGFDEFGTKEGSKRTILQDIENVTIEVEKVGTSVDIDGTYGSAKTLVEKIVGKDYQDNGFAIFEGPLVFPNEKNEKSKVKITVTPKTGTPYEVMTKEVQGLLERDKKLEITLWMTTDAQFIEINVTYKPLKGEEEGKGGMWE